jgi:hypothetical protein
MTLPSLHKFANNPHSFPHLFIRETINAYMSPQYPLQVESKYWWQERFNTIGPFWAHFDVEVLGFDEDMRLGVGELKRILPLSFEPPTTLYRAASERGKNGLSWTPSYQMAQRMANSRGTQCAVWKTTPVKAYGCIDGQRSFRKGNSEQVDDFTIWLADAGRIELVNRWVDPASPTSQPPEWSDRQTTKEEAHALVKAWCTFNGNLKSPAENFSQDFWRKKLRAIGQFTGTMDKNEVLAIAPVRQLAPPSTPLYRAAVDELADGIAWTTELPAALRYQGWRGDKARIWTADASHVYGRVYWHPLDVGAEYWEWFIEPTNIRPYEPNETKI